MTVAIVWLTDTCLDHAGEAELTGFLENMNDICIMIYCTEVYFYHALISIQTFNSKDRCCRMTQRQLRGVPFVSVGR